MSLIRPGLALVVLASAAALAGLVACESATNLDVTYAGDSGGEGGGGGAGGAGEGGAGDGAAPATVELEGCPCDEAAGLGCCVPKEGAPFCTASSTFCASTGGVHLKCFHPDPNTDSVCCWNGLTPGNSAGAVTALASACDGGAPACTLDQDCVGTGKKCAIAACGPGGSLRFGMCADAPPPCP